VYQSNYFCVKLAFSFDHRQAIESDVTTVSTVVLDESYYLRSLHDESLDAAEVLEGVDQVSPPSDSVTDLEVRDV
jgi:hypothetical protein